MINHAPLINSEQNLKYFYLGIIKIQKIKTIVN